MKNFIEKFNQKTNDKYKDLRLSDIIVSLKEKRAEFNFVVPEEFYDTALNCLIDIKQGIEKSYSTALQIAVSLKKSHFDDSFFINDIISFFDLYPSLKNTVDKNSFKITKNSIIHIEISLVESAYVLFESRQIVKELKDYIYSNYCEEIEIAIVQSDQKEEIALHEHNHNTLIYDDPNSGRYIKATEKEIFLGKKIDSPPMYITDATEPDKIVTIAGKIIAVRELTKKNNRNPKNHDNFFKFEIEDATGKMSCLYFPTINQYQKIASLQIATEVIFEGALSLDSYSNTLVLMARNISLCSLPQDFKINRKKIKTPAKYKTIKPIPFKDTVQGTLFLSNEADESASYLLDKTIVVFDLETTGLHKSSDKIIEIGAVKIENGKITQSFATLINPQSHIPESATIHNGITDEMVKDAPVIEQVLPDFLLFTQDAILLGHNSEHFDFPFISTVAEQYNIYFDNPRQDTMLLAQKYLKLKNYKLATIAGHYNIQNETAHRGLSDAIATAKVFMQLAKFLS